MTPEPCRHQTDAARLACARCAPISGGYIVVAVDQLTNLADQIDQQSTISARPGQMAVLERIAGELREIARGAR